MVDRGAGHCLEFTGKKVVVVEVAVVVVIFSFYFYFLLRELQGLGQTWKN